MSYFYNRLCAGMLPALFMSTVAVASPPVPEEDPYAGMMFGNWGGLRTSLARSGVEVDATYIGNAWNVAKGGLKTGSGYNDNAMIGFDLDGEKLWGVKGSKARVSFLNNFGSHTNASRIGSVQGFDNIETGTNTAKIYEAWIEQSVMDDRLGLLLGVHDLNSEFIVAPYGANFIKPVLQIGQSIAQSGQNGPSIFPTPGLAARLRYNPSEESYVMAGAFEGTPGSTTRPHGNHFDIQENEGALLIAEAGITPSISGVEESPNKFGIGVWGYTKQQADLLTATEKNHQTGVYIVSSYRLYNDTQNNRSIGGMLNAGMADGDTAQTNWDYEIGLVGNGWVPSRPDSELGVAFTQSHNGSKYRASLGSPSNSSEYGIEAYYSDVVLTGVTVQPDFQYIINPGTDAATENAAIFGLRVILTL